MKKILLFIIVFSCMLNLAAEETPQETAENPQPAAETAKPAEPQNDAAESLPETAVQEAQPAQAVAEEAAPEQKTIEEPEPEQTQTEEVKPESAVCDCSAADKKAPQKVYFQPTVGMGIGASLLSLSVNTDLDFLLKHTDDGTNIYFGFDIDFRYTPYLDDHPIYEIPLQLNLALDFKTRSNNVAYVALWFSGGINLAFGYLFYYDYDENLDGKDKDKIFKLLPAWGMGLDLLFKNNLAIKLGFDSFYGKYPNLLCAVGYRF